MGNNVRKYSSKFKTEAIKLALNSSSVLLAAATLGMPEATLQSWVQKAKWEGIVVLQDSSTVNVGELVKENQALKKRLARL